LIDIRTLDDLTLLKESVDVECKLAAGRDGKGQLPDDFWPTYSAFANGKGGIIILGLRKSNGEYRLNGIVDFEKIRIDLFNQLNNRQRVSSNLLTDASVHHLVIEGKNIIIVKIPAATRKGKTGIHQRQSNVRYLPSIERGRQSLRLRYRPEDAR
jgi:predicted HTH transcriptional regulator